MGQVISVLKLHSTNTLVLYLLIFSSCYSMKYQLYTSGYLYAIIIAFLCCVKSKLQFYNTSNNSRFFFYSYKTSNNNYKTKAKGAWKYKATLRGTLNIETQFLQKSTKYLARMVIRLV